MLDKTGFDKWASSYDRTVTSDDVAGEYPFAGYSAVLRCVEEAVKEPRGAEILDIGVGTGKFSSGLYAAGAKVYGVDFSARMIERSRELMPQGEFHLFDFNSGLPPALREKKFEYIVSAYAFHHINDQRKADFIRTLVSNLKMGGMMIIADVAFETSAGLASCRERSGVKWDSSEMYMVAETLLPLLKSSGLKAEYRQVSNCAGILTLLKKAV